MERESRSRKRHFYCLFFTAVQTHVPQNTHQILGAFSDDRLVTKSSCHWSEDEAQVEVESIPNVVLVVLDADWKPENLEIAQRNANEAPLQGDSREDIIGHFVCQREKTSQLADKAGVMLQNSPKSSFDMKFFGEDWLILVPIVAWNF